MNNLPTYEHFFTVLALKSKEDFNNLVKAVCKRLPLKLSRTRELVAISFGDYKTSNSLLAKFSKEQTTYLCIELAELEDNIKRNAHHLYGMQDISELALNLFLDPDISEMETVVHNEKYPHFVDIDTLIDDAVKFGFDRITSDSKPIAWNLIFNWLAMWELAMTVSYSDALKVLENPDAKLEIEKTASYAEHLIANGDWIEFERIFPLLSCKSKEKAISELLLSKQWMSQIDKYIVDDETFRLSHAAIHNCIHRCSNQAFDILKHLYYKGFDLKSVNCESSRVGSSIIEFLIFEWGGLWKERTERAAIYYQAIDFLLDEVKFKLTSALEYRILNSASDKVSAIDYIEARSGCLSLDLTEYMRDLIWFYSYKTISRLSGNLQQVDFSQIWSLAPRGSKLYKYLSANVDTHQTLMACKVDLLPMMIKASSASHRGHEALALGLFVIIGFEEITSIATPLQMKDISLIKGRMMEMKSYF